MADKKISALNSATTPLAGTEVLPIVQSGNTVKVSVANLTAGRTVNADSILATGPSGFGTASSPQVMVFAKGTDATASNYSGLFVNSGGSQAAAFKNDMSGSLCAGAIYWNFAGTAYFTAGLNVTSLNLGINNGDLVVGTAGKGIDFSANANAPGMTSELLDWYEEGTWVPVAEGSTSAGTCTYSFQQAHYVRTGGMVQFTCALGWSGHTGTGDLKITGLPFAVPGNQDSAPCGVWSWGLTFPGQLTAYTSGSAINLISIASGAGITAIAVDTDVASLQISGFYFVT